MDELSGRSAFSYRLTEEGDFLFFGHMPDYPSAESTPWYAERRRILRAVAGEGSRVGANGLSCLPALRVADLFGAVEVGPRALAECPRLMAVSLSRSLRRIASTAFFGCPAIFAVDFSGSEEELFELLPPTLPMLRSACVRTVRPAEGETLLSGEIGGGRFTLTEDGTLFIDGAELPDCRHPMDMPWYPHAAEVRRVIFGEGVTRIGAHVTDGMTALLEVTVTGRTAIAPFAFSSCHTLREITVFGTVTEVGTYAFAGTGVAYALMPPSLSAIPEGLYDSCRSLKTLVLPAALPTSAKRFLGRPRPRLRFMGTKEELRALPAGVRGVFSRAEDVGNTREVSPALLRALTTAKEQGGAASHQAHLVAGACGAAEECIALLPRRIDLAETAYLTAETRRLGFLPDLDGEGGGRRAERRRLRARRKAAKAELREEKETAKGMVTKMRELTKELRRAHSRARTFERALVRARRAALGALRLAAASYPLGAEERRRAAVQCEYVEALGKHPRADILATAAERSELYRQLSGYRRFDDVRAGLDDLKSLLSGIVAEQEAISLPQVRPRILVAGGDPSDDEVTAACMRALHRAGADPVSAERGTRRNADRGYDALLIPDGPPVNPFLYSERRHSLWDRRRLSYMDGVDAERDRRDYDLFSEFYRYGKPILGIGRGLHLINVAKGGSLFREMPDDRLALHSRKKGDTVHEIEILPSSYLYKILEPTVRPIRVAGNHRSAIRELGRELRSVAHATDGTVEAIEHLRLPIAGVQFLPERMLLPHGERYALPVSAPDDGKPLFTWFVKLAREVRERPLTTLAAKRFSEE